VYFDEAMDLSGHSILIVESEITTFVRSLQTAIVRKGAGTLVARDPVKALERAKRFNFSAAVVNADHAGLVDQLGMPVLLYGARRPPLLVPFVLTPARPAVLVSALEQLLPIQS
jgi:hypothetical protein